MPLDTTLKKNSFARKQDTSVGVNAYVEEETSD
jgi:hypothetical protein